MRRSSLPGILAFAACGAVVLAWAAPAAAFCRTTTAAAATQACTDDGSALFWRNECRGVRIDLGPIATEQHASYIDTLKVALAQWDKADCSSGGNASISIEYLGETSTDHVGYDDAPGAKNENAVFFRTDDWAYSDSNQVALTTVTFRSDTGDILDADIEVNSTLNISTDRPLTAHEFDLETVFAHELGHVLGLAHSNERTATMYATYNPGTFEQGQLKDDDRAGLCAIYLPDGKRAGSSGEISADSCDVEALPLQDPGDDGCGCVTAGAPARSGGVALLGFAAFTFARRRRSAARR
jgi:MYXO-CTERM domain-containing protein